MKELLMDISYAMGFDGEITPEVQKILQRQLDNEDYHKESIKAGLKDVEYAIEGMRITCAMRTIKRNNAIIERNTIR